jgi:lipopolysaccharide transport system permease protein
MAEGAPVGVQPFLELEPHGGSQREGLPRPQPGWAEQPVLDLGPEPFSLREWLATMWGHRGVVFVLARKDFNVRYKRASLGVLWAIVVPLLQATVLVFVFSHLIHTGSRIPYGAFVLSGILPWTYFVSNLPAGVTSIVDGTGLTDKVWFPRAILPLIPCLSGLVGLSISMVLMLVGTPILGAHFGIRVLLLVPACLLLVSFTCSIALLASALQVYFRDVRFIISAMLMVWLYATPIMYPASSVGHLGPYLDFNPMTGVVTLFHMAILGPIAPWHRAVAVSVGVTALLAAAGIAVHRRYDRLLVDLL